MTAIRSAAFALSILMAGVAVATPAAEAGEHRHHHAAAILIGVAGDADPALDPEPSDSHPTTSALAPPRGFAPSPSEAAPHRAPGLSWSAPASSSELGRAPPA